jgi:hypothetical protein
LLFSTSKKCTQQDSIVQGTRRGKLTSFYVREKTPLWSVIPTKMKDQQGTRRKMSRISVEEEKKRRRKNEAASAKTWRQRSEQIASKGLGCRKGTFPRYEKRARKRKAYFAYIKSAFWLRLPPLVGRLSTCHSARYISAVYIPPYLIQRSEGRSFQPHVYS